MSAVQIAGLVVVLGLAALVAAWYGVPLLHRALQVRRLRRLCRGRGLIALTFDDGPGPLLTSRILDLLERHGARASFFPLGRHASKSPELLDRIASAGHEVGCHGQEHLDGWRVSPGRALADVRDGFETLAPWVGSDGLYRPAHGHLTLPTWLWLRARGARIGWWTLDSGDTAGRDAARVLDAAERGGVILVHDFDGTEARSEYVLEVTDRLLRRAREAGLEVVPFGRLLQGEL